jgi:molybdopterin molybdotransferase/putative molybdopterin biosynthesis protein
MEFDTITREEAMARLFSLWTPARSTEAVPLDAAVGRVVAEPLRARLDLPVERASAGDGIAVRYADFDGRTPDTSLWRRGEDYVRADTGDDFDDRFDTVILIEALDFGRPGADAGLGFTLKEETPVKRGMNVNGRGSALTEGEPILERGMPIRACDLGYLAQGGFREVPVLRRPVIAFIPTGNELVPTGSVPKRGQNIDGNSPMAQAMLREMGADCRLYPIRRDCPYILRETLADALALSDAVVINGGSSKGADDHNARLVSELGGTLICHGVYAAPGRPISIAVAGGKPVVNLPGPVIAAFCGLDWCVRGIVCRYLGVPVPVRPRVRAILSADIAPRGQFPEGFVYYSRVSLSRKGAVYEAWPVPFGHVEGRRTAGFHQGLCVVRGPAGYAKGDEVEVELLYGPELIG